MAADEVVFPITWYDPAAGVVRDFENAHALIAAFPTLDTDRIAVSTQKWLIDAQGRRVRARVHVGQVERLEILPGRPPLPETLDRLRERALSTGEDRDVDARAALVAAKLAGAVLGPIAALSLGWTVYPWVAAPAIQVWSWDIPAVVAAAGGAALLATAWMGTRRYIFPGFALLLAMGAALGALRGWRLVLGFMAPGSAASLPTLVFRWGWELAAPGLYFTVSALLLVFYGRAYTAFRRHRS